jgi:uncharacterized membrane protein
MELKRLNPGKQLLKYFMQGLLYITPISLTIWALVVVFEFIDGLLISHLETLIGYKLPGLGTLTLLVIITSIGFLGSTFIFNPIIRHFDKLISRAPFVKIIYSSIKDFLQAFVGNQKKFTEPVLVVINMNPLIERIGFITGKDLSLLGIDDQKVAVYMPSSYTMLGELYVVSAQHVKPIDASPTEVMKYVISGGVTKVN